MNDTEWEWINKYLPAFQKETLESVSMTWLDDDSDFMMVVGKSAKDCVIKAMGEEYARDQIEDAKPGPGKESLGGVE